MVICSNQKFISSKAESYGYSGQSFKRSQKVLFFLNLPKISSSSFSSSILFVNFDVVVIVQERRLVSRMGTAFGRCRFDAVFVLLLLFLSCLESASESESFSDANEWSSECSDASSSSDLTSSFLPSSSDVTSSDSSFPDMADE